MPRRRVMTEQMMRDVRRLPRKKREKFPPLEKVKPIEVKKSTKKKHHSANDGGFLVSRKAKFGVTQ